MEDETLFGVCEVQSVGDHETGLLDGVPRVQFAVRNQVEMVMTDLEGLVCDDHQVRTVWAFVEGQDLSVLYDRILARGSSPGRPVIDPRILLALWLNATLDGVGSARELDRRCMEDMGYRWICGGVSVNYHTLSDFRVAHGEFLDGLLTQNVAALRAEGLVDLNRVAQDGMRVRASAGTSSFRRKASLERCLEEAQEQVSALKAELHSAPGSTNRRERAARERAAREREERVKRALERTTELQKRKDAAKDNGKKKTPARASTTDPDATVMKMGDGGFRPAVNVQFATTTQGGVIAGVAVTKHGTDVGEMTRMYNQLVERYERGPEEMLVDAGFLQKAEFEALARPEAGCKVYSPVKPYRNPKIDPYAPKKGDGLTMAEWRSRMSTPEAQAIYKERAATAEWSNAQARNRGLTRFTVRGLVKIRTVTLLYALAHNLVTALRLRKLAVQTA